jgi:hypothetical protein
MKKNTLHIFLSNNEVTAMHIADDKSEVVFSDTHLSNLDHFLERLPSYHGTKIRLILDSSNMVIKSIDLRGMNYWHQYQLSRRLAAESKSDWYSVWKESNTLIFIKSTLSDLERTFLQHLEEKHFLVESIVPALWILNNRLLKGHTIKKNGIVLLPMHDNFQHVLYLNGAPTISRISQNTDTTDWVQFIQTKYKIALESFDGKRLIRSLGAPTDTFSLYALTHLPSSHYPKVTFSKGLNLKKYNIYAQFLKQSAYGMAAVCIALIATMTPALMDMNTRHIKLDRLIKKEDDVLSTFAVNNALTLASQSYTHKRKSIESFNAQSFPSMQFLEKISAILPNYGQVIYLQLTPKISTLNTAGRDEFALHLRVVPLKNSKSLQLLTTELHKTFGSKIRVNIIKNPTIQTKDTQKTESLNHTVQINLTGLTHDIQRLTP